MAHIADPGDEKAERVAELFHGQPGCRADGERSDSRDAAAGYRLFEVGILRGPDLGINTLDVQGTQYASYVVNTPARPETFAVAPTWYWNQQPTVFTVGQNVTLYGQGGATRVGGPGGAILVNSLYTPSYGTIILRPGGVPIWNGFRTGF